MSLLRDERGSWSSARCAFWATLVYAFVFIAFDTFGVAVLAGAAYTFLGSLILALAGWAAGPRIAAHIGPQIGNVGKALASASAKIAERRKQGTEDGTEPT